MYIHVKPTEALCSYTVSRVDICLEYSITGCLQICPLVEGSEVELETASFLANAAEIRSQIDQYTSTHVITVLSLTGIAAEACLSVWVSGSL